MNTNSNEHPEEEFDPRLDEALLYWGEKHTADQESLDAAKTRTLHALNQESALDVSGHSDQSWSKSWTAAGALAASLAVLLCCVWSLWPTDTANLAAIDLIDAAALKRVQSDPQKKQLVLNRFRELFGDQLNSVSEVDNEVDISLAELSGSGQSIESKFVSVELVLLSRSSKAVDNDWQIEHRANVLAKSEHRVDVNSDGSPFGFNLWALPIEDDLISIDLRFSLPGLEFAEVVTSELQRSGSANHIHTFTRSGVEYRLYQTGTLLRWLPIGDEAILRNKKTPAVATHSVETIR